ncbi:MAG: hypothetical protein JRF65_10620 [Deltaproteobacteria bacterium]|nr:hypothetical protein [Deltaproteobacteria bacterium]
MILPELAEASAERLGECRVMIHEGREYTNLQFLQWGKRLQQGLTLKGIKKGDIIIRGGENIYPCELEEIMYMHPAVAEAAVVGIPDPIYGEGVIGVAVLKEGKTATEEEIIEFMKTRISKFKAPSTIYFRDSLPKSPVGKILKLKIREEFGRKET